MSLSAASRNMGAGLPRADLRVKIVDPDPTCPECKGRCTDRHGFDCQRCAGEGVVDE